MAARVIVGLDIGTSSVKVVVAERGREGKPLIQAAFKERIRGVRKGVIVDLADASQGVANALNEVKKMSRGAINHLYVSVGTHLVKTQISRGITAVSRVDTEIYQDDIDRVLRASQAVNLSPNRMIIHNVTREFVVDGVGDITDPLGLSGNRLEVNSLIIDVFAPHVKGIIRLVELCGGRIDGMVLSPLTASRAVLSKAQKDLGTALIDCGAGTTGMVVYEEGKLLGAVVFPVGALHITNDIAVGLRIPVDAAEQVKVGYGYAIAKDLNAKEAVPLVKYAPSAKGEVSRRLLAEIIEVRLEEILELVNNELKLMGKARGLPGGVVLVGGGAKLPGLTELVKQELKLSSQIGTALTDDWVDNGGVHQEIFEDPEFVGAIGLVLWGADQEEWRPTAHASRFHIKNIIKYFMP